MRRRALIGRKRKVIWKSCGSMMFGGYEFQRVHGSRDSKSMLIYGERCMGI